MKVTIQKNPEITKDINSIQIPDLWHFAMSLKEPERKMVLEVWHLAHSLKEHIQKQD